MLALIIKTTKTSPRKYLFIRSVEYIFTVEYLDNSKNRFGRMLTNIKAGNHVILITGILQTEFPVYDTVVLLIGKKHTAF